jgi:uncharacterized metal-binding protein
MPSGRTHDAFTILLAAPVMACAYAATRDPWLTTLVAAGFLFGGLMFGPDLDTASKQYARWRVFRFLWFPYRSFFKHRSRWSHGLVFGTMLRVIYFMGAVTLAAFIATYGYTTYIGGSLPGLWEFPRVWARLGDYSSSVLGNYGAVSLLVGMWLGAATHTAADLAGTYIRTGRAKL